MKVQSLVGTTHEVYTYRLDTVYTILYVIVITHLQRKYEIYKHNAQGLQAKGWSDSVIHCHPLFRAQL